MSMRWTNDVLRRCMSKVSVVYSLVSGCATSSRLEMRDVRYMPLELAE